MRIRQALFLLLAVSPWAAGHEVVIYGGTSAGVAASVQAARMGADVVLVSPGAHLGGLTTGGLGWTDSGDKSAIGGISREFYRRVHDYYSQPEAWVYEEPADLNRGRGFGVYDPGADAMWVFEPHVAEAIYEEMLREAGVTVARDAWLDREDGVTVEDGRIRSIQTLDGRDFEGRVFIDATYEGDLMAAAGVSYAVGREANAAYGEYYNGVQKGARHHGHYFTHKVDPFMVPGDPSSGVLPRVWPGDPGNDGEGDKQVQAYCFRMCMTDVPENRVPWPKPEGYDPLQYELLLRNYEAGDMRVPLKIDMMPNRKTDTNNNYAFSTDNIGMNYDYPDADYERRREIIAEHERYQKGLMWTLANHPRVPERVRSRVSKWGLAADEFEDNGNWPRQLYVREARRMIGEYVMTENDCRRAVDTPESVGLGSYSMDSHNTQRYIAKEGFVQNEGDIGVSPGGPYEIAYGSLTPKKAECENLLVPVCISSSHIAFGSVRMEPVFMILGQSAATAAVLSIAEDVAVQDLPYGALRSRLLADGQVLDTDAPPKAPPVRADKLEGFVVDDREAVFEGDWGSSGSLPSYVNDGYRHDRDEDKGGKKAVYSKQLPPGLYETRLSYSAGGNRASNVTVRVHYADGVSSATVDQTKTPPIDGLFVNLGTFRYGAGPAVVEILAAGSDGHVIADAVQWIRKDSE